LRQFLNLSSDREFVLAVAWVLATLRGRGPYPILIEQAEQGSAKTTTMRVLRRMCDPNESDVRRPPRNTEDLMIAASNGHVVALDNLSRLSDELSDTLATLATGTGFSVRRLYTNGEEHIFHAARPIILNGISQVATRGDLLERAIVVALPPIPDDQRRDEATFWRDFELAHPFILGALLDAVVVGLRNLGSTDLPRKPRMADFAIWGVATELACPWRPGTFMQAYAGNQQNAVDALLDGDSLAEFVRRTAPWTGTAAELLEALNASTPEGVRKQKDWFAKPRQVADHLRSLAPALRRAGLEVHVGDRREARTGRRLITLKRTYAEKSGQCSSPSSPPSPRIEMGSDGGSGAADSVVHPATVRYPTNGQGDDGDAGDVDAPTLPDGRHP
jgi:hypothetical protein